MNARSGHGGSPSHAVQDYWWYVARSHLLQASLGTYAVGATRALDIGSADGPSAGWIVDVAEHVAALDIDPRGIGANGVCGSAMALPFGDGSFDVVSAFDVIEHCEPESVALAEVARVLRPGGTFLMAVPAYQWAWSDHDIANGHHRRYTIDRARAGVENVGLTVLRSTYAFASVFPLFAAERLTRRFLGRRTEPQDIAEIPTVPRPLNTALTRLSRMDAVVMRRRDLPFGSSVFLAARKPL
ncbi:MAG: class I SAM-dependent methyltransferase [Actinobacteria bacterium]|nr:class I SAM-dependent methyltransferase [Actinomycetota bacterium]